MGIPLPRPAALNTRLETPIEDWPCIPLLTSRCKGWTDDMTRQQD